MVQRMLVTWGRNTDVLGLPAHAEAEGHRASIAHRMATIYSKEFYMGHCYGPLFLWFAGERDDSSNERNTASLISAKGQPRTQTSEFRPGFWGLARRVPVELEPFKIAVVRDCYSRGSS